MSARLSGTYVVLHQPKEPRVGLGVIVLAGLGVLGAYLLMRPGGFQGTDRVPVSFVFESTNGLTVGDPVVIAGVEVGRVNQVALEGVGRVRVAVEVDERFRPTENATARIRPLNLIGDLAVYYRPGDAPALLAPGGTLAGSPASAGALNTDALLDGVRQLATDGAALASEDLRAQLRETMAAVDRALSAVGGLDVGPMSEQAMAGLTSARSAAAHLHSALGQPAIDSSQANLAALQAHVTGLGDGVAVSREALQRILDGMARGDGTLGRLQGDSALRIELEAVRNALAPFVGR